MSYGHAIRLLENGSRDPRPELTRILRLLRGWCDANPRARGLCALHLDLEAFQRDLDKFIEENQI
jgi:hypothetical protein